ncbi:MAG TPA: organomercurial lyase [Candidatus Bathyarchaeia archaeon]|nr:organomercurial lyase [Candidatus Bathyarchaeia archaeon]
MNERHTTQTTVGLSRTPTLYRLQWQRAPREGKREYVRCGADILLSGLTGDLEAEARCPVCGKLTKLLILDRKIAGLEPKDAVLHVVEMPGEAGRVWVECEATHIFDREACFQKWVSSYKGKQGRVTSIKNYHDLIVRRRTNPHKIVPIARTEPRGGPP